jgi:hypothetical protein
MDRKRMSMKYKEGTVIRLASGDTGMSAKKGAEAVIVSDGVDEEGFIDIRWKRNRLARTQCDGKYYPSQFEIVLPVYRSIERFSLLED